MNAKHLWIAALFALSATVRAPAADLADYLSETTAPPRRPSSSVPVHSLPDDVAAPGEELDIPDIPPRMPALSRTAKRPAAAKRVLQAVSDEQPINDDQPETADVESQELIANGTRTQPKRSMAPRASAVPQSVIGPTPQSLPSHPLTATDPRFARPQPAAAGRGNALGRDGRPARPSTIARSPYSLNQTPVAPGAARAPRVAPAGSAPGAQGANGAVRRASASARPGEYSPRGRLVSRMQPTPAMNEPEPESIQAGQPVYEEPGPDMQDDGVIYDDQYDHGGMEGMGYGGCEGCGDGMCADGVCDAPPCGPACVPCYANNCTGFYGGVELLLLKPRFSEDFAYFERTNTTPSESSDVFSSTTRHHNYDYEGSVRAFLGYRFCECGGELKFTYWNFGANSHELTDPADENTFFESPFAEIVTADDDERLVSEGSIDMNVFDIDYAKCIPLGACDGCCAPWSLTYSFGVRIADYRRTNNFTIFGREDAPQGFISGDYVGAGPKLGLEGRRFFLAHCASLFVKSNFSLLLGTHELQETLLETGEGQTITNNYFDDQVRMVPVGEIEFGGSWQVSRCITLSAGYMFQAWWDLGAYESFSAGQQPGNFPQTPPDDANILSFDGFVFRGEMCF